MRVLYIQRVHAGNFDLSEKPLKNRKYEVIAQQLARGATAVEASLAAGYPGDGSSFAANCRQRANFPQVKARVAALQAKALETLNVDLNGLLKRLWEICQPQPLQGAGQNER